VTRWPHEATNRKDSKCYSGRGVLVLVVRIQGISVTLSELEALLAEAERDPHAFFGDDVDSALRDAQVKCHPDKFPNETTRAEDDPYVTWNRTWPIFDPEETPVRCTEGELIEKINQICPIWGTAYGPTHEDRKVVAS